MTTNKPEVKRYDCTSGGSSHCYVRALAPFINKESK